MKNPNNGFIPKSDDEEKTKLTLSITEKDKRKLKIIAVQRGTTISAMLHDWVEQDCKSSNT